MSTLARLWAARRDRPRLVAVALATLAVLAAYPFVDWWLRSIGIAARYEYFDFGAFGGAVDRWQVGEPLYRRNDAGGFHGGFVYPPVVVLLFVPFDGMGFDTAAATWNLLSLGLLWVALQLLVAELGYDLRRWERAGLAWLLIGFHPLALSIKLGQLAAGLAGLLCLAAVALLRDGPDANGGLAAASGALTALVGLVKLSYAPVGAHLLADRDRLAGALLAAGVFLVASLAVFGPAANRTYLDVLAWGFGKGASSRPPTLWLAPYYRPLQWLPASQWLRIGASLAVAAVAVLAPGDEAATVFALGVAAFPLLTPLAYTYYFVALLPAALVLLAAELDRGDRGRPAVPVAGLLLVHLHAHGLKLLVDGLPALFPPATLLEPYWLLQPGLWGNLLLVGLASLRAAERAAPPAPLDRATPAPDPEE